jgi:hypothetical protein
MHDIIANSKMLILMQTCKLTIVILTHKLPINYTITCHYFYCIQISIDQQYIILYHNGFMII